MKNNPPYDEITNPCRKSYSPPPKAPREMPAPPKSKGIPGKYGYHGVGPKGPKSGVADGSP